MWVWEFVRLLVPLIDSTSKKRAPELLHTNECYFSYNGRILTIVSVCVLAARDREAIWMWKKLWKRTFGKRVWFFSVFGQNFETSSNKSVKLNNIRWHECTDKLVLGLCFWLNRYPGSKMRDFSRRNNYLRWKTKYSKNWNVDLKKGTEICVPVWKNFAYSTGKSPQMSTSV